MFSPPPLERFEPPQQPQEVAPQQVQPDPAPMSNGHGQAAPPTRNAQNGFQNGFTEFVSSSTTKVGWYLCCVSYKFPVYWITSTINQSVTTDGPWSPPVSTERSKEERLFSICVTSILFRIQTNQVCTAYADLGNLKVEPKTVLGRSQCP